MKKMLYILWLLVASLLSIITLPVHAVAYILLKYNTFSDMMNAVDYVTIFLFGDYNG